MSSTVDFFVNGEPRSVCVTDPKTTLLDYLRKDDWKTGTKLSCGQGGCGACTVMISKEGETFSSNSCLRPLLALSGQNVTTVEGLGNAKQPHPVQERIAKANGSQCGFCTPGMVMSMYSLLEEKNGNVTRQDVQRQLDGNICRCTGYRPILEALDTFCVDCPGDKKKLPDIEDLAYNHARGGSCHAKVQLPRAKQQTFSSGNATWHSLTTLAAANDLRTKHKNIRWVVGNTSEGVYGQKDHPVYADISRVPELGAINVGADGITFGSAVTISKVINTLSANVSRSQTTFPAIINHLKNIANKHVRDCGSWTGNLMMQKLHGFPSDLVTVVYGAGATFRVSPAPGAPERNIQLDDFFSLPNEGIFLLSMTIPFAKPGEHVQTYRTALRPWNAHALLNASMSATLRGKTIESIRIVYGVVSNRAVRAKKTEAFLQGKSLDSPQVLTAALQSIGEEIRPEPELQYVTIHQPQGKDGYRRDLVPTFLYKFLIHLAGASGVPVQPRNSSASAQLQRPLSTGTQVIPDSQKPRGITKTDAISQATGEARYTDDIPTPAKGLYGSFVTSTKAHAKILSIDASAALKIKGVVDFICAKDVPGVNDVGVIAGEEPLFATDTVVHVGQSIGFIVATSQTVANRAAQLVKVTYQDLKAIVSIADAVAANSFLPLCDHNIECGDIEKGFRDSQHVVEGKVAVHSQLHFYMEKMAALASPDEGGRFVLDTATQCPDIARGKLAAVMGVKGSDIAIRMRRAGGAFGGKATRIIPLQAACLVASNKLKVPVRSLTTIQQDQDMTGGRHDFEATYKIGFNSDGSFNACQITSYGNAGFSVDLSIFLAPEYNDSLDGVYRFPNFKANLRMCKTNLPTKSAIRSFGHVQATGITEQIVEHVAAYLKIDAEAVRERNHYNANNCITPFGQHVEHLTLPTMWDQLKKSSNIAARKKEIAEFNANNAWKKRGIAMLGIKYGIGLGYANGSSAMVAIGGDGSVICHHSGCEIGQGIHVKVQQTIAEALGCPLSMVRIADTNSDVLVSMPFTGGSGASEINVEAARQACLELNARLAPVKELLRSQRKPEERGKDLTWGEIIGAAAARKVNLQSVALFSMPGKTGLREEDGLFGPWQKFGADYYAQGVACTESEVDLLTGEVVVRRADILYDCGESLNPVIDIGQAEGAFMQGLGYYLREDVLFSPSGVNHSNDTWEYKPPCVIDVPSDLRIELLKDSPFPRGIKRSKAVAEPPLLLGYSVFASVKDAIARSRKERGLPGTFDFRTPATPDRVRTAAGITLAELKSAL